MNYSAASREESTSYKEATMVEKRFRVLRAIATIAKVLSWIVLVVGTLVSLGILVATLTGGAGISQFVSQLVGGPTGRASQQGQLLAGTLGGLIFLVGLIFAVINFLLTVLYFLVTYGMGEVIYLFLAMEENTRATSTWIGRWLQVPSAPPQS
jgi:hypothetical protein